MDKLIVGSGKYTYEVLRPWGILPSNVQFGNVTGVAVDSMDRVYVYQRCNPPAHPILVFDRDGAFLNAWGANLVTEAHGIHISIENHVYLVSRDHHEVLKCTTSGQVLMRLGNRNKPIIQSPFNHPTDIAVSPEGDIFVADGYGNSAVHKFSSEGDLLHSWGSPGKGPGQFRVPHGIWVGQDNRVYVTDRENSRLQIFTTDGIFIDQWADFHRPMSVYVDPEGASYVTDLIPRFTVLDQSGLVLARGRPVLYTPHGICGDSNGDLYIAQPNSSHAVTKLVRKTM